MYTASFICCSGVAVGVVAVVIVDNSNGCVPTVESVIASTSRCRTFTTIKIGLMLSWECVTKIYYMVRYREDGEVREASWQECVINMYYMLC